MSLPRAHSLTIIHTASSIGVVVFLSFIRYAVAQSRTRKNVDRYHVHYGKLAGICDGIVALYDGHGGGRRCNKLTLS